MERFQGCIFPMIGGDVQVDLVVDQYSKTAGLVVQIEGKDEVTVFAMPLEGLFHFRQHLDECIEILLEERKIQESN